MSTPPRIVHAYSPRRRRKRKPAKPALPARIVIASKPRYRVPRIRAAPSEDTDGGNGTDALFEPNPEWAI